MRSSLSSSFAHAPGSRACGYSRRRADDVKDESGPTFKPLVSFQRAAGVKALASAPPMGQEHGRGDLPRARRRIVPNCERFQIAKVIPARADVQESWILRDERRARVRPAAVGTPTGRYAYARRPERTTSLLADSLATDAWGKATA